MASTAFAQTVQETAPGTNYSRACIFTADSSSSVSISYSNGQGWRTDASLQGNEVSREIPGCYRSAKSRDPQTGKITYTVEVGREAGGSIDISINGRTVRLASPGSGHEKPAAETRANPQHVSNRALLRPREGFSDIILPDAEHRPNPGTGFERTPAPEAGQRTEKERNQPARRDNIVMESRVKGVNGPVICEPQAIADIRACARASYGICLTSQEDGKQVFKPFHGGKWLEQPLVLEESLSANERDRRIADHLKQAAAAGQAPERIGIHCSDKDREVPPLTHADGEIFRVMQAESAKPGGLALAFTGFHEGKAQYCFYQMGRQVDGRAVEPRWACSPIELNGNLSAGERNAELLKACRDIQANPPLHIASSVKGYTVSPVDRSRSPEDYKVIRQALEQGYEIRLSAAANEDGQEELVFTISKQSEDRLGKAAVATVRVGRNGNDYYQKRDSKLANALRDELAQPSMIIPDLVTTGGLALSGKDYGEAQNALKRALGTHYCVATLDTAAGDEETSCQYRVYRKGDPVRGVGEPIDITLPRPQDYRTFNDAMLSLAAQIETRIAAAREQGQIAAPQVGPSGLVSHYPGTPPEFRRALDSFAQDLGGRYPGITRRFEQCGYTVAGYEDVTQSPYTASPAPAELGQVGWHGAMGRYNTGPKVADVYRTSKTKDGEEYVMGSVGAQRTAAHELGHAVAWMAVADAPYLSSSYAAVHSKAPFDALRLYGASATAGMRAAYDADFAALPQQWRNKPEGSPVSYYLQPGENGPRECLAEAVSFLLLGEKNSPTGRQFAQRFPNMMAQAETLLARMELAYNPEEHR